jgi:hypothetical protein
MTDVDLVALTELADKEALEQAANDIYLDMADALCLALSGHAGNRGQCHTLARAILPFVEPLLAEVVRLRADKDSTNKNEAAGWEYALRYSDGDVREYPEEVARRFAEGSRWSVVVRRRPAGEWQPV